MVRNGIARATSCATTDRAVSRSTAAATGWSSAVDIGSNWARSSRPSIATRGVDRAGVVARSEETGVAIEAFVALKPGQKKSIIAMKRHCTMYLPHYMIPDRITFLDGLPVTSTDKVDYQRLKSLAAGGGSMHVRRRAAARIWSWKFVFYDLLLPALRRLGPARGDRILGWLGRIVLAIQPRRRARLARPCGVLGLRSTQTGHSR